MDGRKDKIIYRLFDGGIKALSLPQSLQVYSSSFTPTLPSDLCGLFPVRFRLVLPQ